MKRKASSVASFGTLSPRPVTAMTHKPADRLVRFAGHVLGYTRYQEQKSFIQWCAAAAQTPGHPLEDPKLRRLREVRQQLPPSKP